MSIDSIASHDSEATSPLSDRPSRLSAVVEIVLLVALFFVYAGDMPPMVNEAHYLVKAKNFWDPSWCANDLFASSGKAHTTFYALFGWPTRFCSLETTAWAGRLVGWLMLAIGLQRLCSRLGLVPLASLPVAALWIVGIEYGNLAGEWVVGGIEAKVPAYGLVLVALAELVDRNWHRVWPLLGAASAFHVLSGGWSVIAAMLCWWVTEHRREDRRKLLTVSLFVGGLISLLGLVPAFALTAGSSSQDATAAAHIYAYFRIKHHLLPADFLPHWYARHGILIAGTIALSGFARAQRADRSDWRSWRAMLWFSYGAIAIAAVGLLLGALPALAPDLAAKLLRFYWFRMTDAIVPLMFALLVARLVLESGGIRRSLTAALMVAGIACFVHSCYQRHQLGVPPSVSNRLLGWDADAPAEQQQQVYKDWLAVCRWAQRSSERGDVFLTPRHQQTFKWYAERAEVVNWKDVPQDAASLREWFRRFRDIYPQRLGTLRVTIRYDDLKRYRSEYGVRYLIVDQRISANLPLVKVYPRHFESNETYAAYLLPSH